MAVFGEVTTLPMWRSGDQKVEWEEISLPSFFHLLPSKIFGTRLKARLSVKFKGRAYGLHPAHNIIGPIHFIIRFFIIRAI
jgi:hypothetical protein